MRALSSWLKRRNWSPKQVQCFIPTPGSVATAMFYGGIDPEGNPLYVARSDKERMAQHYLLTGGSPADARQKGRRRAGTAQKRT
jgi:radical SAM superfamily enzyme YgiQ (UPF0313 family)